MIDELNDKFGIGGTLVFDEGSGGLPRAVIKNALSSAEIYLHGAHVTAFCPRGGKPVLWKSDIADFQPEKAIRGGIPVVWPWFGPHPLDKSLPQHGFARVSSWTVFETRVLPDGGTEIGLLLQDDEKTRALWPHPFRLELRAVVGADLRVELRARNTGTEPIEIGGALHSYFLVGDIGGISIDGLDGRYYMDQLDDHNIKTTSGTVSISGEVDRIYVDTDDQCVIDDPSMDRWIRVAKTGSRTTVVWNPWIKKSQRMADFPDEGYRSMVCIEAANATGDIHRIPPDGEHTLSQTITEEPF
jgi:D-hexose-6-phosphate mutarotase